MTPDKETHKLLCSLISKIIDHPSHLEVKADEVAEGHRDTVVFSVQASSQDYGRIAGKMGCHINALKMIVSTIGRRMGGNYALVLLESNPGLRVERELKPAPARYNPAPAFDLLKKLVGLLAPDLASAEVMANPDSQTFVFTIHVRDEDTYALFLAPKMAVVEGTLAGAIDTIFRAIARRGGATFRLQIVRS